MFFLNYYQEKINYARAEALNRLSSFEHPNCEQESKSYEIPKQYNFPAWREEDSQIINVQINFWNCLVCYQIEKSIFHPKYKQCVTY